METIAKVWFDDHRIYINTSGGETLSRPLEAFPRLMEATPEQRAQVVIGRFGDDLRWESLDEDIHISSFYEKSEPNYDNEIARLFRMFPQLNVSQVALSMGINKSLLAKYIYGIVTPSPQRVQLVKKVLHDLGQSLIDATDY